MKNEYTVVMLHSTMHSGTALDGIVVEVKAANPDAAVAEAQRLVSEEDLTEPEPDKIRPLAVFEGHSENIIGSKYC